MKKRTLKVFTFFAAVLILTSAASYFFIKGYIYPLIIKSTQKVISEFTGGETEIGKVELSIIPPGIEMTQIRFSAPGLKESSFSVKAIRAELNPIQALSGTININRISVIEPEADLFLGALQGKLVKKESVSHKLQPEFFKANIKKIRLKKGHFIVRFNDKDFIEIGDAYLSTTKTEGGKDTFSLKASRGKVSIRNRQEDFSDIRAEGIKKDEEIDIENISVSPDWGKFTARAKFSLKPSGPAEGSIRGKIPFSRFSRYLKKDIPLRGEGDLAASFSYKNKRADLKASLGGKTLAKPIELNSAFLVGDKEIKVRKAELRANKLSASLTGSILSVKRLKLETRVRADDLSNLLSPFMTSPPEGRLEAAGKIEGSLAKPELKTDITIFDVAYRGLKADKLTGVVNYHNGKLWTEEMRMTYGNAALVAEGKLSFAPDAPVKSEIQLKIPSCKLPDLLAMAGRDYPVEGQIESRLSLAGNLDRPEMRGEVIIDEGEFWGEKVDRIEVKGNYTDKAFTLQELLLRKDRSTLTAKGTIPEEGEMDMAFKAKAIDLSRIANIQNRAEGIVNLEGKIKGKPSTPIVRGTLTADNIKSDKSKVKANLEGNLYARLNTGEPLKQMISYSSGKLELKLNKERTISLTPFTIKYEDGLVSFTRTSFSDRFGSVSTKGSLSLKGDANISLKAVAQLEGLESKLKGVEDIEGRVDVDVKIRGKIDRPSVKGTIKAQKGLVRFKGFPYDMKSIEGKLNLRGNRFTVDNLKGQLEGANFTGGGHLIFDGYKPSEIKLYFDVEEVDLTIPRWLPSRSKGRMTVSAIGKEVTLGGDIEVLRASYTEKIEFKNFLSKIVKITDTKKIDEKKEKKADEDDLNVKIHFRADDNLIIKNNLSEIELKGDLILIGKGPDLSIIGNLETIGGKAFFRNREYLIRRGTVDFTNRERIVPVVNIDAESKIKDYLLNVNVTGPPKNLVFTMSSDPPLEEKEIVSLITFGYTGNELRGEGTELTSLGAASLIFQEDIEAKIKQYFGFDRLRIEPYYSQTAETTEARITLDKDLSKNTTATYSRGMSTLDEEVKLEYKLDDHLSFKGSWASTEEMVGAFGGDVVLRFEFE